MSGYQELGKLGDREKVYLMRNTGSGEICVRKSVSVESEMIYRFIQANPSPYVPRIYDCVAEGDQLMILEEYIVGRNLEELLAEKTFSMAEGARIMLELCEALKLFHHAQPPIICRDLKPANIMLSLSGDVKIVDFDIARSLVPQYQLLIIAVTADQFVFQSHFSLLDF